MNESCHTSEGGVASQGVSLWMFWVHFKRLGTFAHTHTHTNTHTHTHMTHPYMRHDSFICVTWLIHMCAVTHTCDTTHTHNQASLMFSSVTWLIHTRDMTHSYEWHDSFIWVTWLIHMCDMTHSCEWHDSFIRVTWLIHMRAVTHMCDMTQLTTRPALGSSSSTNKDVPVCDMTYLYGDMTHSDMWHDSFIHVTWLIHMCDSIPFSVTLSSITSKNLPVSHHAAICVTGLIRMCDMTH